MITEGKLYVVATPIGNLGDISLRAIETLSAVDAVFAEDTRVVLQLLNHLKIKKKVHSCHKDNEKIVAEKMLELVNDGAKIAFVSDAGNPCISDPGGLVVRVFLENGVTFEVIPGISAFIPGLIYSGFDISDFYFEGFLPKERGKAQKRLKALTDYNTVIVFYESVHRVSATLKELLKHFPPPISVSREITKLFEETVQIHSTDDIELLTLKGEFVITVNNRKKADPVEEITIPIEKMASALSKEGIPNKTAVNILKDLGVKRNRAYDLIK